MKTKDLTILAMLIAITAILAIVPNLGIIQIGVVSLTIMHIPVILASLLFGIKGGAITGLCFGLASFYVASTRAYSPVDLLFVNPLISILPRLLFGILSGLICSFFIKKNKNIYVAISSFICTIIHTLLVYIALYIWGRSEINIDTLGSYSFIKYILAAISINSILEALTASTVCLLLFKSIKHLRIR